MIRVADDHASRRIGCVSTPEPGPDGPPLPALASRLGYLIKHAQQRLAELTAAALAPFGVTGREVGVLTAIDHAVPLSQQEVAARLGVDRTTMVALTDDLEAKGLVRRRPDPADRRRNLVALTAAGRAALRGAGEAAADAERQFLAGLDDPEAAAFRRALRAVAFPAVIPGPPR
jgi:DNA-binding MarR family transcriptional regulator